LSRLTSGLLVLFLPLLLLPEVSSAQCPPDNWPTPPNVTGWRGRFTSLPILLPGTTCYVTYTYCSRTWWDGGLQSFVTQIVVETITPIPSPGCADLTPDQMIKLLYLQLNPIGGGAAFGPPTPCTHGFEYVTTYANDCWDKQLDANGDPYYIPCDNPNNYCQTTCQYCQNSDGTWNSTCTSTSIGTAGCATLPSPDVWVVGACYDIVPCGTPH
jgi:hypothetical protein